MLASPGPMSPGRPVPMDCDWPPARLWGETLPDNPSARSMHTYVTGYARARTCLDRHPARTATARCATEAV